MWNLIRPSLDEALRERVVTLPFLEEIRGIYLRKIEKVSGKELWELRNFFERKETEERYMLALLRRYQADYPRLITPDIISSKERKLLLWSGLVGECERRL